MNKIAVAILTAALLLGACSSAQPSSKTANVSKPAAASAAETKIAVQTQTADKGPTTDAATTKPPASPSVHKVSTGAAASPSADAGNPKSNTDSAASQSGPSAAKLYAMNQNYFLKPLSPQTDSKVVLLTFDDAPKAKTTIDGLLKALDKHHAKAIFFVNGYRVKANPDLLKELAQDGQTIGNHSWDHINLSKLSDAEADSQIDRVSQIVQQLTGKPTSFFRPPYAAGDARIHAYLTSKHVLYMNWSDGSLDWADNQHKPEGIIQTVLSQLHPGSIILMHEYPWTVQALDPLLTALEQRGYSFADPQSISIADSAGGK